MARDQDRPRSAGAAGTEDDLSAERTALVLAASDIGLWDLNPQTGESYFSPEWCRQLGLDQAEMAKLDAAWRSLIHPEDRARVEALVDRAYEDPAGSYEAEFRLRHKDGSYRWILSKGRVLRDGRGKAIRMLGAHLDITRRKQAEAALKESEARYRQAQKLARIGHWIWRPDPMDPDPDRGIGEYSDEAAAIVGVPAHELGIGNQDYLKRFVHPDDQEKVAEAFSRMVPGQDLAYAIEYRIVGPDGEVRTVYEICENIMDERGSALFSRGTVQDITDLKRTEAALVEQERMYRAAIETAMDAFLLLDDEGRVVEWSPQAEAMFGWKREEMLGRKAADVLFAADPGSREQARALYFDSAEGEPLSRRFETRALRKSGGAFPAEISVSALQTGERRLVSAYVRDLTQQRQTEQQLRESQKMEAVGQLSGGIAHDFNNLLMIVVGNLDLMLEGLERDPTVPRALGERARDAALRGADLIKRLLAFARRQALKPEPVDLAGLIRELEPLLERALGETIRIETKQAPDLWRAFADANQLQNALLNLALNAKDAMPEGGRLTLGAENFGAAQRLDREVPGLAGGDHVRLSVIDEGAGMPAEVRERAFEPFFTTKRQGRGTGLGLAMVYGFVKQSGGQATIESEPGRGTTVSLYLPRAEDGVATAKPAGEHDATGSERVLLVEDDAMVRDTVSRLLGDLGYLALAAEDASGALKLLNAGEKVDLLLTDMVMPGGMDGWDLAQEAWRRRPDLRVILSTGYADSPRLAETAADQRVSILSKPYRRNELAAALRRLLDDRAG